MTGDDFFLRIKAEPDGGEGAYIARVEIRRAGELVEKELQLTIDPSPGPSRSIDLQVSEAELHDVLDQFAELLESELVTAADLSSERVTVSFDDVPWQAALDDILLPRGLQWKKVDDLLLISGRGDGKITRPDTSDTSPMGVELPKIVERVPPEYTADAKEARVQGVVILDLLVDELGNVREVEVVKPLPFGLSEAAADAAREWKFSPASHDGKAVSHVFRVTIEFRLPE